MKTRTAVLFALIATVLSLAAPPARAADTVDEARRKGVLVVGVRDDAPPFGFIDRDTGETVGIEADLAAAVARRLDVRLRLKTVTAAGWLQDLVGGNVDLVAATIGSTPDRAKLVDFSQPYFTTTQRVLARKGTVASLKDLEGKRIGTGQGTAAERDIKTQVPTAACYFFSDARKAIDALTRGEVDALSASGSNLYGCLSALPEGEFEIAESVKLSEEDYRIAVRKDDARMLEIVNATLAELDATGGSRAILDRWFRGKGDERAATVAIRSSQSTGVVTRTAATENRVLVLPFSGYFRRGADVSFFDPDGTRVGEGHVASVYGEETYVDLSPDAGSAVRPGFVAASNLPAEEVRRVISAHRDAIDRIRSDAKAEEERILREAGREFEQANKERAKYQEDITRTRMMLDYQYSDQYYRYYGYPFR